MRLLAIVILALLVLSCERQPVMFQPDTKVSQSVPAAQIGPQIDTLFSSWKEFDNWREHQSEINELYSHQLDNGCFGIEPFDGFGAHNWLTSEDRWLDAYESITINFTYIITPSALLMDFGIEFGRGSPNGTATFIVYFEWHPQSADTFDVSCTIPMDTIYAITNSYTYQDIDLVAIGFMHNQLNQDAKYPYSVNTYTSYLSELLITGVRRQQREISP